jgi:hypothetical protein
MPKTPTLANRRQGRSGAHVYLIIRHHRAQVRFTPMAGIHLKCKQITGNLDYRVKPTGVRFNSAGLAEAER